MFGSGTRDNGVVRRRLLKSGAALVPAAAATVLPPGMAAAESSGREHGGAPEATCDCALPAALPTQTAHWDEVAAAFGRPGAMVRGTYYHTRFPRSDLRVVCQGVRVTPGLAVASHASFAAYDDGKTMLMGDLVVPEAGLEQFVDDLQAAGIMITALHKHLLTHTPALWWLHACALTDDPAAVAAGLRGALERSGTPAYAPVAQAKSSANPLAGLDTAAIDAAFGAKGSANGEVYSTAFVRRDTVVDGGRLLPAGLGATTAVNLQPVGRSGRVAVSGDFAMTASEVPAALAALRRGGLQIVSLHNHSLTDEPRLFFAHFWAVDDAVSIARAVGAAVALTNVEPAKI